MRRPLSLSDRQDASNTVGRNRAGAGVVGLIVAVWFVAALAALIFLRSESKDPFVALASGGSATWVAENTLITSLEAVGAGTDFTNLPALNATADVREIGELAVLEVAFFPTDARTLVYELPDQEGIDVFIRGYGDGREVNEEGTIRSLDPTTLEMIIDSPGVPETYDCEGCAVILEDAGEEIIVGIIASPAEPGVLRALPPTVP